MILLKGEFDKKRARELEKTHDELMETQGNLVYASFLLTQPRVLSPDEKINILLDAMPNESDPAKSFVGAYLEFWKRRDFKVDVRAHWKEAAELAFALSFLVLVLEVLIRWTGYGLDEWEVARQAGRPANPEALQGLRTVTDWATKNQVWIVIADMIARILKP